MSQYSSAAAGGSQIDPLHAKPFEPFSIMCLFWQPVPAGQP